MSRSEVVSLPRHTHPAAFAEINMAAMAVGMPAIAPEVPITQAAQQLMQHMQSQLPTKFQGVFGVPLPAQNQDNGYVGPIEDLQPGDSPPCVVDQVKMDFSNWGLPITTDIATRIASTMTRELSVQGGAAGFQQGTLQVTSNENIIWMVGYGAFTITQNELGAVYVFGAALQFP
jgi:hypothetical protein